MQDQGTSSKWWHRFIQGLGWLQLEVVNQGTMDLLGIAVEIVPLMGDGAVMVEVEAIMVGLQMDLGQEGLEGLEGQEGLVDPLMDHLVGHHVDFITVPPQHHHCHRMEVFCLEDPVMKERESISRKGKKGRDMKENRKEKER